MEPELEPASFPGHVLHLGTRLAWNQNFILPPMSCVTVPVLAEITWLLLGLQAIIVTEPSCACHNKERTLVSLIPTLQPDVEWRMGIRLSRYLD